MKNLNKNLCLILILLTLNSCGLASSFYNMGWNMASGLSPHKYKVKKDGEGSFPANGMSIVSLNFKNNRGEAKVDTLWRKINADGTVSKRMKLTYWDPFRGGRRQSMIEPGTYFLDGTKFFQDSSDLHPNSVPPITRKI